MPDFLPLATRASARVMMFVDGENLSIRYGALLEDRQPPDHVVYEKGVYVWSRYASRLHGPQDYIRRYYYTSAPGDDVERRRLEDNLRKVGIQAPRVFPRLKGSRSKRVDIALATDMLSHAHRRNYDIAILVAGDEDYVPLVEAVEAEGCRVAVWFVASGLSPTLRAAADHYWDLGELLFNDRHLEPAFEALYG